ETPKQARRTAFARPLATATRHVTRHSPATVAVAATVPVSHRVSSRSDRPSSGERGLPKQVAVPESQPAETTKAPAALSQSTPPPEATPLKRRVKRMPALSRAKESNLAR